MRPQRNILLFLLQIRGVFYKPPLCDIAEISVEKGFADSASSNRDDA